MLTPSFARARRCAAARRMLVVLFFAAATPLVLWLARAWSPLALLLLVPLKLCALAALWRLRAGQRERALLERAARPETASEEAARARRSGGAFLASLSHKR